MALLVQPGRPHTGGGTDATNRVADLERLAELRDDGTLTEAEFQAEKAKLMG